MEIKKLQNLLAVASGKKKATLVLKRCRIVDVYTSSIIKGDIAVEDGLIAGIGNYEGWREYDMQEKYALPGLIDSHLHLESTLVAPEEFARFAIAHGTTTVIVDPHEIANVCGKAGIEYLLHAAAKTPLTVRCMLPSCVPATALENNGATLDAAALSGLMYDARILGLGEFMDFSAVINGDAAALAKIALAQRCGKLIDGHIPDVSGKALNAYLAAGITSDHETSTLAQMQEKLAAGMQIFLREGSACHDLRALLAGVTPANERFCAFCSDDRQIKTIIEKGHLDDLLRICAAEQLDTFQAIRMASLNTAQYFKLQDRGAVAPGKRADLTFVDDLQHYQVDDVYIAGKLMARGGRCLVDFTHQPIEPVAHTFHVKDFCIERLAMKLKTKTVRTIKLVPQGIVTQEGCAEVALDENGNFAYQKQLDVVKLAVVERHKGTGSVGLGFLEGYGLKAGALAVSIAHDSHNIISAGTNDRDMAMAIEKVIAMQGGVVLVKDGQLLGQLALPIAGLMSDLPGEQVKERLDVLHATALQELQIDAQYDPIMTLSFMALPVIPQVRLTDRGLFNVDEFRFQKLEKDGCEKDA